MKTILIQQVYPNGGYLPLLLECIERNAHYCEERGIVYQATVGEKYDKLLGGWDKVELVNTALVNYDLVIWLDVDAIIYDLTRDIRTVPLQNDTIGVVKFMLPSQHLNCGVMYFKAGPRVTAFMEEWIGKFPGRGAWREQAEFNAMKNEIVKELPQEWNRNFDGNPLAKPVIMGFHGFGDAQTRLKLMQKMLKGR